MKKKLSQLVIKIREDKKNMFLVIVLTGILLLVIAWPVDTDGKNKNQTMQTVPNATGSQTGGEGQNPEFNGQQVLDGTSGGCPFRNILQDRKNG